jgi:hypothetical protein
VSVYLPDGAPGDGAGVHILGDPMQRLVLHCDYGAIDRHIENAASLTYCLEYSASLGKHAVSQYLLKKNVPVTRQAIINAAGRRGPGLDILFGAIREQDKPAAMSAGMTFRMSAGDFDKAYSMLDAGVVPDQYFISAAYTGAMRRDDGVLIFQDALDRLLPVISKEALASSHLELLVEAGRPVHIERVLEKLGEPVHVLMPRVFALSSQSATDRLRDFGAVVDEAAIVYCARHMNWKADVRPDVYLERLCQFALADGYESRIQAESIRPLLESLLYRKGNWFRIGRDAVPTAYKKLAPTLAALVPCVIPQERDQLIEFVRQWSSRQPAHDAFTDEALADIQALIDAVSIETMDLLHGGPWR